MNYKRWVKIGIDLGCMWSFRRSYKVKLKQVSVVGKRLTLVKVSDITDNESWQDLFKMYFNVLHRFDEHGRKAELSDTLLYKKEYSDAPKGKKRQVKERFDQLYKLYQSIKKHGYQKRSNKLIRLMDVSGLATNKLTGSRATKKYYRLSGMRRCIICKYLGIKKIPCRVLKIKVVQL